MQTFRDLKVWQKAHQLVLEVYKITRSFPADEKFGLTIQLRRSAASIATNIVEGFKRKSDKHYSYFLNIADASLEETKYHIILAHDLHYIKEEVFKTLEDMANEVGRMLCGLQKSIDSGA